MVDHSTDSVMAYRKIGGQARAMVVTGGSSAQFSITMPSRITCGIRKSTEYRSIVAFPESTTMQASRLPRQRQNGFPRSRIPERFQEDPYRFLMR